METYTNPINGSKVKPDRMYNMKHPDEAELLKKERWEDLTLDDENEWCQVYSDKNGGGVIVKKIFDGHKFS